MCRYAYKTYKAHYVCFDCRKVFKQPPPEDLARNSSEWEDYQNAFLKANFKKFQKEHPEKVAYLEKNYKHREFKCPECHQLMSNLGLDFKAPPQNKRKEWEIIRGLYVSGKMFLSCGCDGPGLIPKNKSDYVAYLEKRKSEYQKRLENRDKNLAGRELGDYLNYWNEKVKKIERVLNDN